MNIGFEKFPCTGGDVAITCLFEDRLEAPNNEVNSMVQHFNNKGSFKGANGEIASFFRTIDGITQDFIVVGLGKEVEVDSEKIRRALGKAVKKAIELKSKKVFVTIVPTEALSLNEIVKAMVEGMGLAAYKFDKYKSDNKSEAVLEFSLGSPDISNLRVKEIEEIIEEAKVLVESTELARNLVNEPANVIYPETLAEEAIKVGNKSGFEVEVFDRSKIEKLKMDAFLSVARGSNNEPKFIVMRYLGNESNKDKILGLVGKGVTYDSGGYSLKPNESMVTMKSDMGGAATVIGVMSAIAKRKLKINIVAVIAACENLISGNSYKPGDVISSMAGKSIEILNTDAEGRLTLIDAVHYVIEKERASEVIDVATLTGAALVALGTTTTAVVTNNQQFYKELKHASKVSGERIWQLPSFSDYRKMLKSDIADLKNVGGRHAGTITAGLFIGEFVQNKPWLHLDIAGTSWSDSSTDYCPKGGTGAGVRILYELIKNRC